MWASGRFRAAIDKALANRTCWRQAVKLLPNSLRNSRATVRVLANQFSAQFGQPFAAAFRAMNTAEPAEPGAITYMQVADADEEMRLTQEPVDF